METCFIIILISLTIAVANQHTLVQANAFVTLWERQHFMAFVIVRDVNGWEFINATIPSKNQTGCSYSVLATNAIINNNINVTNCANLLHCLPGIYHHLLFALVIFLFCFCLLYLLCQSVFPHPYYVGKPSHALSL